MTKIDFEEHNREVEEVWASYHAGHPVRMPMIIGVNPRHILMDATLNTKKTTFAEYSTNPAVMLETQLQFRDYAAHHIWCDSVMGLPEVGWPVYVDFQNVYEAGWYGAEIVYSGNNSPFSKTLLTDDCKNLLFEKGIPDPISGSLIRGLEFYNYFLEQKQKGYTYKDRPIDKVTPGWMGTDGPMTVACDLRGTENFAIDLYEDPEYAMKLLDYITESTIVRIKVWRKFMGQPENPPQFGFADDSIVLLSVEDYKRFIMPFHKRLIQALSTDTESHSIHLCGDASRFFPTLRDELNIMEFDTGFPIDHAKLTHQMGPKVQINGGPKVDLLLQGTPEQVEAETKRIIEAVRPNTRRFIMREANNLSPGTPEANLKVMYETVRKYGIYE